MSSSIRHRQLWGRFPLRLISGSVCRECGLWIQFSVTIAGPLVKRMRGGSIRSILGRGVLGRCCRRVGLWDMARLKPASWSMISGRNIILLCEAVSTRKRSPTRRWSRRMGIARARKTCLRLPQMENVSIKLIPAIKNNVLAANYREVQILALEFAFYT